MTKTPRSKPSLSAARLLAPAGGGAFAFDRLSIGVFLVDQPTHRIAIGSDAPTAQPLTAHQGWVLPPGAEGYCAFDADHEFVSVELAPELLRDVGFDPSRPFAPRVGAHDPLLAQMALAAATPPQGAPTLYVDTMRHALAAHVTQLLAPPAAPDGARLDDARLRRAVDYIEDNLAADLTLGALASEAAMSPFHFSRAFKRATGRAPLQYVIAARLARAKTLLATTALPIAEIAHRVGYADVSRFGKHFKRRYGAAPSAARG